MNQTLAKWKHLVITTCALSCFTGTTQVTAIPFSDFEDGTMQGWHPVSSPTSGHPFGGIVTVQPTGGHPGAYLRVEDTVGGGGGLFIGDNPEFAGDLSVYDEVRWDELLLAPPVLGIRPFLHSPDGTLYRFETPPGSTGTWRTWSVPLAADDWSLVPGTGSTGFEDVLGDASLLFNMDVSTDVRLESGIDNITLVPEPASIALLALGGVLVMRPGR